MKRKRRKNKTHSILCFIVTACLVICTFPSSVNAAGIPPYTPHAPVSSFCDRYDLDNQTVETYMVCDQAGDITCSGSGTSLVFTASDINNGFVFSHWETYYYGPIEQSSNYNWSNGQKWCFSKVGDISSPYERTNKCIQVNNEWNAIGTYYIVAVYNVKVSVNVTHEGISDTARFTAYCQYENSNNYHNSISTSHVGEYGYFCKGSKGIISISTNPNTEVLDSLECLGTDNYNYYYTDSGISGPHYRIELNSLPDRPIQISVSFRDKPHNYVYTANDNIITQTCNTGCGHISTAVLKPPTEDYVYDGNEHKGASVEYGEDWQGDKNHTIIYKDNVNAGTATASVTIGNATANTSFDIAQAEPQVTSPTGLSAKHGDSLWQVTLPDGWSWRAPTASVGELGTNQHSAYYDPKDPNYKTILSDLTVTVTEDIQPAPLDPPNDSINTGDNNPLWLWLALIVISCIGIIALISNNRKQKPIK